MQKVNADFFNYWHFELSENLKKDKINTVNNKEIIALIAYLQRVGTDIKLKHLVIIRK